MVSHRWWADAVPFTEGMARGGVVLGAIAIAIIALATPAAIAPSRAAGGARAGNSSIDTEDLFGFVEGSDIGARGQTEAEADTSIRFGKHSGSFADTASQLELKYTALQNFRISADATLAFYDIAGVAGLEDRREAAVQSLSFDARFRVLDRAIAPFGVTLSIEPHLGFADETSGVPINHFGIVALLLADREIVPDRLFGALDLSFDTDRTHRLVTGVIAQEPTPGIGAALAARVMPGVWLGAEARYLRAYDGAALNLLSGQALYVGPTLYARPGENIWLSVAWNFQAWGEASGFPGALDLVNFERHQVKFRVGYEF